MRHRLGIVAGRTTQMDRTSMLLLAACMLCSGVAHVAARNPQSADAAMGRRLQQVRRSTMDNGRGGAGVCLLHAVHDKG